jgi:hypothetical protein
MEIKQQMVYTSYIAEENTNIHAVNFSTILNLCIEEKRYDKVYYIMS